MTDAETPAALMRRAAALMRERAEYCTDAPWRMAEVDLPQRPGIKSVHDHRVASFSYYPDATHAASWHPLVALAIADLLERDAALADAQVFPRSDPAMERYSLAVARAYLGEQS